MRVAAGLTLLVLSVDALRASGWVRWLAGVEIAAAVTFCLPRILRIGATALLLILGIAFAHHAVSGHFASSLLFATFTVVMALVYERT